METKLLDKNSRHSLTDPNLRELELLAYPEDLRDLINFVASDGAAAEYLALTYLYSLLEQRQDCLNTLADSHLATPQQNEHSIMFLKYAGAALRDMQYFIQDYKQSVKEQVAEDGRNEIEIPTNE